MNALFDAAYNYKICIFAINSDTINRSPAMLYGDGYVISYCFPDWLEQEVHSVGKYADSHGIFRRVYDPSNGGYSNWNAIPDLSNRLVMNAGSTGMQSPFSGSTSHRLQIGMDGGITVWKTTDNGTTWNIVRNL